MRHLQKRRARLACSLGCGRQTVATGEPQLFCELGAQTDRQTIGLIARLIASHFSEKRLGSI